MSAPVRTASGCDGAQVRSQLAAFGDSMEKDSAAQRSEVTTLVQRAAERGKDFIDDTLQLSNVQARRMTVRTFWLTPEGLDLM
jgi:hypothetical protein